MKRLWRWLGASVASVAILVTGGGIAQKAVDFAGLDDTALGNAFRQAFGISPALAQELSFFAFFDAQLAALGPTALPSDIQAALAAAIAAYIAAGGTALPTPEELAAAYPTIPGITAIFVAALQEAIEAGVITVAAVQLALAGDLS
ncbi:MAG: hypothetical protein IT534_09080 [Bauldia sp.]|nr:hypothetical protein [Bauldia sp.]